MARSLPILAALLLAACASWRGADSPPPRDSGTGLPRVAAGTGGPEVEAAGPDAVAPLEPSPVKRETAVFYSDLGPDELDVSSYPLLQRQNYRVYAQACSRCHGLSRSLHAPYASGAWWEFYVLSMRARGRLAGRPFTKEERRAVLDFLQYDSKVRKIDGAAEFEARSAALRRAFNAIVDERMERLQKSAPLPRR